MAAMKQQHEVRKQEPGKLEDCRLTATLSHDFHALEREETKGGSLGQLVAHQKNTIGSFKKKSSTHILPLNVPSYYTEWDAYLPSLTFSADNDGPNAKSQTEMAENGSNSVIDLDQDVIIQVPRPRGVMAYDTDVANSAAPLVGNWQDGNNRVPQIAETTRSMLAESEEEAVSVDTGRRRASEAIERFEKAF